MKVAFPEHAYVRHIADRIRSKDAEEFLAVMHNETRDQLAEDLVRRYTDHPHGFCFLHDDGEPVGLVAMIFARPNVATLTFFATDRFPEIAISVTRFATRNLFPKYMAAGVHRIECASIAGYAHAHRWIQMLGMNEEGRFPGWGKNGETFHQFAMLAEDMDIRRASK
jgi:hypothetical protein